MMNSSKSIILLFMSCWFGGQIASAQTTSPLRVRVLTYNIRHGEGMDGKLDLERIAKTIAAAEPDVVSLQEVDRGVTRSQKLDEPRELGRLLGMEHIFERNIVHQGGDYGNAVLTRLPVKGHKNYPLPSHTKGEQRGALVVELTAPDGKTPLRFIATHFDYRRNDGERLDSVSYLDKLLTDLTPAPTILAGDLNSLPESATLKALDANWKRAEGTPQPTFPADHPNRQIDFVLARPTHRWRILESRVIDEPVASDHRPLLVVLEHID